MFHLISDLASVPSGALCDLVLVFARLQRQQPALMMRIVQQVEARIERGQLKLPHMYGIAWGLRDMHSEQGGGAVPPVIERLMSEAARRTREVGADQLIDTLTLVSFMTARRPWKLLEPLIRELRQVNSVRVRGMHVAGIRVHSMQGRDPVEGNFA